MGSTQAMSCELFDKMLQIVIVFLIATSSFLLGKRPSCSCLVMLRLWSFLLVANLDLTPNCPLIFVGLVNGLLQSASWAHLALSLSLPHGPIGSWKH